MFKLSKVVTATVALAILIFSSSALAQAPGTLMYQGKLSDAGMYPITAETSVIFTIYDAPTAGTALWTSTLLVTPNDQGVFTVELGAVTPFPPGTFDGSARFLEIQVSGDDPMTPRQLITSAPYSMYSSGPGFANSFLYYVSFGTSVTTVDTLEIQVPGPGFIVLDITGIIYGSHVSGTSGWLVAMIDTLVNQTDWMAWAWIDFPSTFPTDYYAYSFAATRVAQVDEAGLYTFYMNAQTSGLTSTHFEQGNFKGVYYPTYLGTESPLPYYPTATAKPGGPEADNETR